MGRQIALNAAIFGYEVRLTDPMPGILDNAGAWAKEYLSGRVAKQKMTQAEAGKALGNFHPVAALDKAAAGVDLVIEAIIEKQEEKKTLFRSLDKILAEDVIIATNSSFMVSSVFKDCVRNPSRLANLHYFNPALAMKLVEIVQGEHTSDATVNVLKDFVVSIGKVPVMIKKEIDGFIVNRISRAISFAALELVSLGVAGPEDVDLALENGLNHPMGPFRLMDLTGVDLSYYAMTTLEEAGEHHAGYELIKEKFDKGEYGIKSGKGWYEYPSSKEKK
jgi:3-hydroxybutyryl-CoA dehydrogenase